MKRPLIALAAVLVIGAGVASVFVPACTDCALACEFTGSHRGYRQWLFGIRTQEWYRASPIERRLAAADLKHQWVAYQATQKNVFGKVLGFGRGRPHDAALQSDIYWPYYASLSDEELRTLYEGLQTADKTKLNSLLGELDVQVRRLHGRGSAIKSTIQSK